VRQCPLNLFIVLVLWLFSTAAQAQPYIFTTIAPAGGPTGIATDDNGHYYITEFENGLVRTVGREGTNWVVSTIAGSLTHIGQDWIVTTLAGSPGVAGSSDGIGSQALFKHPYGIAVDPDGTLFVADTDNNTIRMGRLAIPSLGINIASNQVVLNWPSWANNYVLEMASTPILTSAWTTLTNGVAVSGDTFFLTNALDSPAAFYRLREQ
jgi:hypothetical protein